MSAIMSKKQQHALGQYMTTNQQYILQNLHIPSDITHIVEPFAGNKDLLNFIQDTSKYQIEMFDIEPQSPDIVSQDTISSPPIYTNKFVLTNPPYLARNKSQYKELFDKYNVNDLYKCFLTELLSDNAPAGGIIIIPLNFWSSIRKADIQLRKQFLDKYEIIHLNIFEERVFDDTTTTVCSRTTPAPFKNMAKAPPRHSRTVQSAQAANKAMGTTTLPPVQKSITGALTRLSKAAPMNAAPVVRSKLQRSVLRTKAWSSRASASAYAPQNGVLKMARG